MKFKFISMLFLISSLSLVTTCQSNYGENIAKSSAKVTLTIIPKKIELTSSEEFKYSVVFKNNDTVRIRLVKPGDGSFIGWRTPEIKWINTSKPNNLFRCGNINTLKTSEIIELDPGQEIKIDSSWIGSPPLKKGPNKITLNYKNIPDIKWEGVPLGSHDPIAWAKMKTSTFIDINSNILTVVVK